MKILSFLYLIGVVVAAMYLLGDLTADPQASAFRQPHQVQGYMHHSTPPSQGGLGMSAISQTR